MTLLTWLLVFGSIAQFGVLSPELDELRVYFVLSVFALAVFVLTGGRQSRSEVTLPQIKLVALLTFSYALSEVRYMWMSEILDTFLFWLKKALLFYLFVYVIADARKMKAALWALVLAMIVLTGVAWDNYFAGIDTIEGRLCSVGNYNNPNSFGLLLTVSWPMIFALMETERNPIKKALLFGLLSLTFLTCIYTKSRGSLLGMSVSIMLCLAVSRRFLKSKSFKALAMAGVYLAVTGFAVTMIMSRSDVTGMSGSAEASGGDRLLAWKAAVGMFLDHPLLGVGWNHFRDYCLDYGMDKRLVAHNTPLSVLSETGIVGFSLFVALLLVTFRQLIRMIRFYRGRPDYEEFYVLCYGVTIALACFQVNTLFSVKDHEPAYWLMLMFAGALWLVHLRQEKQLLEEEATAQAFSPPQLAVTQLYS